MGNEQRINKKELSKLNIKLNKLFKICLTNKIDIAILINASKRRT